jgi:hypothetical protein
MEYGSCEGLDRHYRCCIVVCLIGRAAILVIMYVEISKTDDIVLIGNVMVFEVTLTNKYILLLICFLELLE